MAHKRRKLNADAPSPTRPPLDPQPTPSTAPVTETFSLPFPDKPDKSIPCIRQQPAEGGGGSPSGASAPARLVFTHGAGGGLTSAAVQDFSRGFAREAGLVCFQGTLHLGSRVKAFAAGERREEVLRGIPEGVDVLFVSGDRDGMCDLTDLRGVVRRMKGRVWLMVVQGADHGMELKGKGDGGRVVREKTGEVAARWLETRDEATRHGLIRRDEDEGKVVEAGWHRGVEY
nr:hypothetical protein CFP56_04507 [Quercus suber]